MILCDVGNTHLHFWRNGQVLHVEPKELTRNKFDQEIYYISVNEKNEKLLHKICSKAYNLDSIIKIPSEYVGLGVDRRAACIAVKNGAVIDAGSAITIDLVEDGKHLGGCILPGINELNNSYGRISPALKTRVSFGLEPESMPQSTKEAVFYGLIKSIILTIRDTIGSKKAYFTGGDGKYLSKFFNNSVYDETLVFRGMRISIQNALKERKKENND